MCAHAAPTLPIERDGNAENVKKGPVLKTWNISVRVGGIVSVRVLANMFPIRMHDISLI